MRTNCVLKSKDLPDFRWRSLWIRTLIWRCEKLIPRWCISHWRSAETFTLWTIYPLEDGPIIKVDGELGVFYYAESVFSHCQCADLERTHTRRAPKKKKKIRENADDPYGSLCGRSLSWCGYVFCCDLLFTHRSCVCVLVGFLQTCVNQIWLFTSGDRPLTSPSERLDSVSNLRPRLNQFVTSIVSWITGAHHNAPRYSKVSLKKHM